MTSFNPAQIALRAESVPVLCTHALERGSGEKECKRGKGMPRRVEGVGGRQLVKERRIHISLFVI
jgi:hypothetical protein